jgi:hypothetical protein
LTIGPPLGKLEDGLGDQRWRLSDPSTEVNCLENWHEEIALYLLPAHILSSLGLASVWLHDQQSQAALQLYNNRQQTATDIPAVDLPCRVQNAGVLLTTCSRLLLELNLTRQECC